MESNTDESKNGIDLTPDNKYVRGTIALISGALPNILTLTFILNNNLELPSLSFFVGTTLYGFMGFFVAILIFKETNRYKILTLALSAPSLITSLINKGTGDSTKISAKAKVGYVFSLENTAYARPGGGGGGGSRGGGGDHRPAHHNSHPKPDKQSKGDSQPPAPGDMGHLKGSKQTGSNFKLLA